MSSSRTEDLTGFATTSFDRALSLYLQPIRKPMNEGATIGLVFVWIEFVSLWTLICLYNYVLVKKNELV